MVVRDCGIVEVMDSISSEGSMVITITEEGLKKSICRVLDIPEYVVEITSSCIIFRSYNKSIIYHHFFIKSPIINNQITLFEDDLLGDFSESIIRNYQEWDY